MNPANSQEALAQLQQIQSQAQNPNDILANQRQQLGVNAANETVTGLRGAINNTTQLLKQVAPSVMGRTGNSLVTSAQAGRIIQNEQAPISQNLADQGQQYSQAAENLNKLESQAGQAASGIYQGQQDKLSYAQNLYNTLYQKERDAQQAAQAEANRQEQIRQFNEQQAASQKAATSASASNSPNWAQLLSSVMPTPKFIGNDDLRGRLAYAAQKEGNQDAAIALKYVGNDGKYYLDPYVTNPSIIKSLNAVGATNVWKQK